jgi:hypothetical protein
MGTVRVHFGLMDKNGLILCYLYCYCCRPVQLYMYWPWTPRSPARRRRKREGAGRGLVPRAPTEVQLVGPSARRCAEYNSNCVRACVRAYVARLALNVCALSANLLLPHPP